MKKSISIEYREYSLSDVVIEENKELLLKAKEASQKAYAKYSKFNVGAAVLLEDGTHIIGSNQENAAYPSGLCAERVALFAAHANFPDVPFKTIAIYANTGNDSDSQLSPCGSCRQVMQEYEDKQKSDIKVILMDQNEMIREFNNCSDLLPLAFNWKG